MTMEFDAIGSAAARREAARAMRVLEGDVYETLEHARLFRGRIDPTWPPPEWPPDVTTGDDLRNWLQRIDQRSVKTEKMLSALCWYLLPKSGAGSLESQAEMHEGDAASEADESA
jgi:hypothetical protein